MNEVSWTPWTPDYSGNGTLDQRKRVERLEKRLRDDGTQSFVLDAQKDRSSGCWDLSFFGRYTPDLFSDLTGVIALHNINILYAEISTWEDVSIANILIKTGPIQTIDPEAIWKKVMSDVQNRLTGKLALAPRLNMKLIASVRRRAEEILDDSRVVVDNASSDLFTLIKISARDRLGLLYWITQVLHDLRLVIRVARITTTAGRVEDVFYVHDAEGKKIEEREQVKEIKRALLYQVSQT